VTPDLDDLLADINKARHQAGMNAWWQDVLARSYRAIGDLREVSAINESGCDRALQLMESAAHTCKALTAKVEQLKQERLKLDKRIHNQRVALRSNWQIIEKRAQYRKAWYRSPLLTSLLIKSTWNRRQPWWRRILVKLF
jgi:hypothetical protein